MPCEKSKLINSYENLFALKDILVRHAFELVDKYVDLSETINELKRENKVLVHKLKTKDEEIGHLNYLVDELIGSGNNLERILVRIKEHAGFTDYAFIKYWQEAVLRIRKERNGE